MAIETGEHIEPTAEQVAEFGSELILDMERFRNAIHASFPHLCSMFIDDAGPGFRLSFSSCKTEPPHKVPIVTIDLLGDMVEPEVPLLVDFPNLMPVHETSQASYVFVAGVIFGRYLIENGMVDAPISNMEEQFIKFMQMMEKEKKVQEKDDAKSKRAASGIIEAE